MHFRLPVNATILMRKSLLGASLLLSSWLTSGLCHAQSTSASVPAATSEALAASKSVENNKPPEIQKAVAATTANTQVITVTGYDRRIRQEHFKGLSKNSILQMQKQLGLIYQDLAEWKRDFSLKQAPLSDGIVGPITLSWLQRFGFNFKINAEGDYANAFADNINRIAAFGEKHKSELQILVSPEFESWDSSQSEKIKTKDYQIRRQGNDSELIELVNRFRGSRKTAPRIAQNRNIDESAYFTYSLSQADLEVLGSKDQVIQILSTLKDKEFNSTEALRVAVSQAMGERDYFIRQLWPLIEKNAGVFDGYLINEAALTKLKQTSEFPAAVIDELRLQGTQYFKERDDFDKFLKELSEKVIPLSDDERNSIADAALVFDNVHLTEQSINIIKSELKGNIQNTGLPAVVVRALQQMKDVNYPEISLFRAAAISKIAMSIGACKLNSPSNNSFVGTLRMSDEEFSLLKKELNSLQPQAIDGKNTIGNNIDNTFSELEKLRAQLSLCDSDTLRNSRTLVQSIYQTYLGVAIENIAKKRIPDEISPIQIKGNDCGCALDEFSGTVYGFYPYWNNQKTPQTINFQVLNRVAYYGLTVDNVGELHLGSDNFDVRNGSAKENQFLNTARQYNSKVDWVIQKNDWNGDWRKQSRANKQAVFKKLVSNITLLLHTRLTDAASKLRPYTSFGLVNTPTRGDGVTIYFQNYPQDADAALLFNEFYADLRKELAQDNVWLNILVSQETFTNGQENKRSALSLTNLVNLQKKADLQLSGSGSNKPVVEEHILVLLEEPSSDAKKRLQGDIENEAGLHGERRARFLRRVIPVVQFDNHNWQQLEDDIVYASDNFGGIGFWAPDFNNLATPITDMTQSCNNGKNIALCVLKNNREQDQVENQPSVVEKFTCVYRGYLQLMLTLLVLLAITLAILYFKYCEVQNLVKKYFLWVLALMLIPIFLLFTLLLFYDPYMVNLSKGKLPFIISLLIIISGIFFGYLYLRSKRDVPLRQNALPQRQGLGFPIIMWSLQDDDKGFRWVIRNQGTGYAIIKKVEILLDGQAIADAKTALEAVLGPDNNLQWNSMPLIGQKIMPGETVIGLAISDPEAATAFDVKLQAHQLKVNITYCSANNEHWLSNGKEISSLSTGGY
ncbi:hypothetical protein KDM87_08610 [Undibacterium sp. FT147W]|uniref:Peptidoglycan binding-like domain-containing protein n=1 Tax=Undibacterium rivi TaxID=2828729 RepID=A0ABS5H1W1_9BURK|nr:hypothetical protein [Undibacterium rivi]MBR7792652.1 hypothetical protein [Undibacterium rivi]